MQADRHTHIHVHTDSHSLHVALRKQRDLQQFGTVLKHLVTGCGHSLACDAVDLIEGMRPQHPVVCRPDEQLERQGLALHVAMELRNKTWQHQTYTHACWNLLHKETTSSYWPKNAKLKRATLTFNVDRFQLEGHSPLVVHDYALNIVVFSVGITMVNSVVDDGLLPYGMLSIVVPGPQLVGILSISSCLEPSFCIH